MLSKEETKQRALEMYSLAELGYTLQEIGDIFSLSRERVRQIINTWFPYNERRFRGAAIRKQMSDDGVSMEAMRRAEEKWGFIPAKVRTTLQQAHFDFFRRKKQNARSTSWEWYIQMHDLDWPTHCPVLGVELDWFATKRAENSPSMDRMDNTKGYLPGNVAIVSYRANRIKNDGTWQEHEKIAAWLKNKEDNTSKVNSN